MKDKSIKKLVTQPLQIGKTCSGVAIMVFSLLCTQTVSAEQEVHNISVEQSAIPVNLALDSQPLDVDAIPVVQTEELTIVAQPGDSSVAPTALALAETVSQSETGGASLRGAVSIASSLVVVEGETSQISFALMLALLALIAVVPISRRH